MNETREQILGLIELQELSAVAIATELNLSPGAVRRHLDLLVADDLVTSHIPLRSGDTARSRGRPSSVYRLSDTSEMLRSAMDYRRLLGRLAIALQELNEEDISGKDGTQILEIVSTKLAHLMFSEYKSDMRAKSFEAKIVEVISLLSGEGILRSVHTDGDEYVLSTPTCPIKSLSRTTHAVCEADRQAIELLIGEKVTQVQTIAKGAATCEYRVCRTS